MPAISCRFSGTARPADSACKGGPGQPDDLPGAILSFASAEAGCVTGQVLSVSGGLTMNG